jgi:hypothetical protein
VSNIGAYFLRSYSKEIVSLAAVDMHTARHIFNNCLASDAPLRSGRTVLLVTHHVSLCLPATSFVVELDHGRVVRQGSVEELRDRGLLSSMIEAEDLPPEPKESTVKVLEPSKSKNDADHDGPSDDEQPHILPPVAGKLVDEEARAEGRVSLRTYLLYVKAAGWISWLFTFILLVSSTAHLPLFLIEKLPPVINASNLRWQSTVRG